MLIKNSEIIRTPSGIAVALDIDGKAVKYQVDFNRQSNIASRQLWLGALYGIIYHLACVNAHGAEDYELTRFYKFSYQGVNYKVMLLSIGGVEDQNEILQRNFYIPMADFVGKVANGEACGTSSTITNAVSQFEPVFKFNFKPSYTYMPCNDVPLPSPVAMMLLQDINNQTSNALINCLSTALTHFQSNANNECKSKGDKLIGTIAGASIGGFAALVLLIAGAVMVAKSWNKRLKRANTSALVDHVNTDTNASPKLTSLKISEGDKRDETSLVVEMESSRNNHTPRSGLTL